MNLDDPGGCKVGQKFVVAQSASPFVLQSGGAFIDPCPHTKIV